MICLFSGTYSRWPDKTHIPVVDADLYTTCTPWASGSFLKHATCSRFCGASYNISVLRLVAPESSRIGIRSFSKRRVNSVLKCLSRKEAFVLTRSCFFLTSVYLVGRRLSAPVGCTSRLGVVGEQRIHVQFHFDFGPECETARLTILNWGGLTCRRCAS